MHSISYSFVVNAFTRNLNVIHDVQNTHTQNNAFNKTVKL
jgi:hypothetical protein